VRNSRLPLRGCHKRHRKHIKHKKDFEFFYVPFVIFVLLVALLDGHGLGQVAWLVDVTTAPHCDVIRKQLQWNDRENR